MPLEKNILEEEILELKETEESSEETIPVIEEEILPIIDEEENLNRQKVSDNFKASKDLRKEEKKKENERKVNLLKEKYQNTLSPEGEESVSSSVSSSISTFDFDFDFVVEDLRLTIEAKPHLNDDELLEKFPEFKGDKFILKTAKNRVLNSTLKKKEKELSEEEQLEESSLLDGLENLKSEARSIFKESKEYDNEKARAQITEPSIISDVVKDDDEFSKELIEKYSLSTLEHVQKYITNNWALPTTEKPDELFNQEAYDALLLIKEEDEKIELYNKKVVDIRPVSRDNTLLEGYKEGDSESSTVIMGTEIGEALGLEGEDAKKWYSFPTLFPKDPDNPTSNPNDWIEYDHKKSYQEALKRNEVFEFGDDKDAAIAFGEGSWKTEEEVKEVEEFEFDAEEFRIGINEVEASGRMDYSLTNPTSSAVGPYQFLYSVHKDILKSKFGVNSKEEFIGNEEAQEGLMDYMLEDEPGRYTFMAKALEKKYSEQIKELELSFTDLLGIEHFIGHGTARKLLADVRDGKINKEEFFKTVPGGLNLEIGEYLNRFRMEEEEEEDIKGVGLEEHGFSESELNHAQKYIDNKWALPNEDKQDQLFNQEAYDYLIDEKEKEKIKQNSEGGTGSVEFDISNALSFNPALSIDDALLTAGGNSEIQAYVSSNINKNTKLISQPSTTDIIEDDTDPEPLLITIDQTRMEGYQVISGKRFNTIEEVLQGLHDGYIKGSNMSIFETAEYLKENLGEEGGVILINYGKSLNAPYKVRFNYDVNGNLVKKNDKYFTLVPIKEGSYYDKYNQRLKNKHRTFEDSYYSENPYLPNTKKHKRWDKKRQEVIKVGSVDLTKGQYFSGWMQNAPTVLAQINYMPYRIKHGNQHNTDNLELEKYVFRYMWDDNNNEWIDFTNLPEDRNLKKVGKEKVYQYPMGSMLYGRGETHLGFITKYRDGNYSIDISNLETVGYVDLLIGGENLQGGGGVPIWNSSILARELKFGGSELQAGKTQTWMRHEDFLERTKLFPLVLQNMKEHQETIDMLKLSPLFKEIRKDYPNFSIEYEVFKAIFSYLQNDHWGHGLYLTDVSEVFGPTISKEENSEFLSSEAGFDVQIGIWSDRSFTEETQLLFDKIEQGGKYVINKEKIKETILYRYTVENKDGTLINSNRSAKIIKKAMVNAGFGDAVIKGKEGRRAHPAFIGHYVNIALMAQLKVSDQLKDWETNVNPTQEFLRTIEYMDGDNFDKDGIKKILGGNPKYRTNTNQFLTTFRGGTLYNNYLFSQYGRIPKNYTSTEIPGEDKGELAGVYQEVDGIMKSVYSTKDGIVFGISQELDAIIYQLELPSSILGGIKESIDVYYKDNEKEKDKALASLSWYQNKIAPMHLEAYFEKETSLPWSGLVKKLNIGEHNNNEFKNILWPEELTMIPNSLWEKSISIDGVEHTDYEEIESYIVDILKENHNVDLEVNKEVSVKIKNYIDKMLYKKNAYTNGLLEDWVRGIEEDNYGKKSKSEGKGLGLPDILLDEYLGKTEIRGGKMAKSTFKNSDLFGEKYGDETNELYDAALEYYWYKYPEATLLREDFTSEFGKIMAPSPKKLFTWFRDNADMGVINEIAKNRMYKLDKHKNILLRNAAKQLSNKDYFPEVGSSSKQNVPKNVHGMGYMGDYQIGEASEQIVKDLSEFAGMNLITYNANTLQYNVGTIYKELYSLMGEEIIKTQGVDGGNMYNQCVDEFNKIKKEWKWDGERYVQSHTTTSVREGYSNTSYKYRTAADMFLIAIEEVVQNSDLVEKELYSEDYIDGAIYNKLLYKWWSESDEFAEIRDELFTDVLDEFNEIDVYDEPNQYPIELFETATKEAITTIQIGLQLGLDENELIDYVDKRHYIVWNPDTGELRPNTKYEVVLTSLNNKIQQKAWKVFGIEDRVTKKLFLESLDQSLMGRVYRWVSGKQINLDNTVEYEGWERNTMALLSIVFDPTLYVGGWAIKGSMKLAMLRNSAVAIERLVVGGYTRSQATQMVVRAINIKKAQVAKNYVGAANLSLYMVSMDFVNQQLSTAGGEWWDVEYGQLLEETARGAVMGWSLSWMGGRNSTINANLKYQGIQSGEKTVSTWLKQKIVSGGFYTAEVTGFTLSHGLASDEEIKAVMEAYENEFGEKISESDAKILHYKSQFLSNMFVIGGLKTKSKIASYSTKVYSLNDAKAAKFVENSGKHTFKIGDGEVWSFKEHLRSHNIPEEAVNKIKTSQDVYKMLKQLYLDVDGIYKKKGGDAYNKAMKSADILNSMSLKLDAHFLYSNGMARYSEDVLDGIASEFGELKEVDGKFFIKVFNHKGQEIGTFDFKNKSDYNSWSVNADRDAKLDAAKEIINSQILNAKEINDILKMEGVSHKTLLDLSDLQASSSYELIHKSSKGESMLKLSNYIIEAAKSRSKLKSEKIKKVEGELENKVINSIREEKNDPNYNPTEKEIEKKSGEIAKQDISEVETNIELQDKKINDKYLELVEEGNNILKTSATMTETPGVYEIGGPGKSVSINLSIERVLEVSKDFKNTIEGIEYLKSQFLTSIFEKTQDSNKVSIHKNALEKIQEMEPLNRYLVANGYDAIKIGNKIKLINNKTAITDRIVDNIIDVETVEIIDKLINQSGSSRMTNALQSIKTQFNLMQSLSPDMKVKIYTDNESWGNLIKELGLKIDPETVSGFVHEGKAYFNAKNMDATVAIHEQIGHPFVDILEKSNPTKYQEVENQVEKWILEIGKFRNISEFIKTKDITGKDVYTKAEGKKELVVEFLSQLISGEIELEPIQEKSFNNIRKILNTLMDKLGIDYKFETTNETALFIKNIADKMAVGETPGAIKEQVVTTPEGKKIQLKVTPNKLDKPTEDKLFKINEEIEEINDKQITIEQQIKSLQEAKDKLGATKIFQKKKIQKNIDALEKQFQELESEILDKNNQKGEIHKDKLTVNLEEVIKEKDNLILELNKLKNEKASQELISQKQSEVDMYSEMIEKGYYGDYKIIGKDVPTEVKVETKIDVDKSKQDVEENIFGEVEGGDKVFRNTKNIINTTLETSKKDKSLENKDIKDLTIKAAIDYIKSTKEYKNATEPQRQAMILEATKMAELSLKDVIVSTKKIDPNTYTFTTGGDDGREIKFQSSIKNNKRIFYKYTRAADGYGTNVHEYKNEEAFKKALKSAYRKYKENFEERKDTMYGVPVHISYKDVDIITKKESFKTKIKQDLDKESVDYIKNLNKSLAQYIESSGIKDSAISRSLLKQAASATTERDFDNVVEATYDAIERNNRQTIINSSNTIKKSVQNKLNNGIYTNQSNAVRDFLDIDLNKIKDIEVLKDISETLSKLDRKNVAEMNPEQLKELTNSINSSIEKIEKSEPKYKSIEELSKDVEGMYSELLKGEIDVDNIDSPNGVRTMMNKVDNLIRNINRSLDNGKFDIEVSDGKGGHTIVRDYKSYYELLDIVNTEISRELSGKMLKYNMDKHKMSLDIFSSIDLSKMSKYERDLITELLDAEFKNDVTYIEDLYTAAMDVANGYIPVQGLGDLVSKSMIQRRAPELTEQIETGFDLRSGRIFGVPLLDEKINTRLSIRPNSLLSHYLGIEKSGIIDKSIISPLNRAHSALVLDINETIESWDKSSKTKLDRIGRKYRNMKLGVIMMQIERNGIDGVNVLKTILETEALTNKYREDWTRGEFELTQLRSIYKSLPKKYIDGVEHIDIDKAIKQMPAKMTKMMNTFREIMDKDLQAKQKFANELNGESFTPIDNYFPRYLKGKNLEVIIQNNSTWIDNHYTTGTTTKSSRGINRTSNQIAAYEFDASIIMRNTIYEVNRDFYLSQKIKDVGKLITESKYSSSDAKYHTWYDAIRLRMQNATELQLFMPKNSKLQKMLKNTMGGTYALKLFRLGRFAVELPIETYRVITAGVKTTPTEWYDMLGVVHDKQRSRLRKLINIPSSIFYGGGSAGTFKETGISNLETTATKLQHLTNSPTIHKFTRHNMEFSKDLFGKHNWMQSASNYGLGMVDRMTMNLVYMPSFKTEFFKITGERFNDREFNTNSEYSDRFRREILDAASIADRTTAQYKNISLKFDGRTHIQIPGGNTVWNQVKITDNPKIAPMLTYMSSFGHLESLMFSRGMNLLTRAESTPRERAEGIKQMSTIFTAGAGYSMGVSAEFLTYDYIAKRQALLETHGEEGEYITLEDGTVVPVTNFRFKGEHLHEEELYTKLKELEHDYFTNLNRVFNRENITKHIIGNAMFLGTTRYSKASNLLTEVTMNLTMNWADIEELGEIPTDIYESGMYSKVGETKEDILASSMPHIMLAYEQLVNTAPESFWTWYEGTGQTFFGENEGVKLESGLTVKGDELLHDGFDKYRDELRLLSMINDAQKLIFLFGSGSQIPFQKHIDQYLNEVGDMFSLDRKEWQEHIDFLDINYGEPSHRFSPAFNPPLPFGMYHDTPEYVEQKKLFENRKITVDELKQWLIDWEKSHRGKSIEEIYGGDNERTYEDKVWEYRVIPHQDFPQYDYFDDITGDIILTDENGMYFIDNDSLEKIYLEDLYVPSEEIILEDKDDAPKDIYLE